MIKFYTEKLEPKKSTVNRLLMFSKSISAIKSEKLDDKFIINLN